MKKTKIFIVILIMFFFEFVNAQDDIQIGSQGYGINQRGALFDYSDPTAVNIKVQLWGYVDYLDIILFLQELVLMNLYLLGVDQQRMHYLMILEL